MQKMKIKMIVFLINILGGMLIDLEFEGNKGIQQVHNSSYFHYQPFKDKLIINWDSKTVILCKK